MNKERNHKLINKINQFIHIIHQIEDIQSNTKNIQERIFMDQICPEGQIVLAHCELGLLGLVYINPYFFSKTKSPTSHESRWILSNTNRVCTNSMICVFKYKPTSYLEHRLLRSCLHPFEDPLHMWSNSIFFLSRTHFIFQIMPSLSAWLDIGLGWFGCQR